MSHRLIARSSDLSRLQAEGFAVEIRNETFLLVHDIPYVNATREVGRGTFVCELNFSGTDVIAPSNHVMHFVGDYPCDSNGRRLDKIFNDSTRREISSGLFVDHTFSAAPKGRGGYVDYYEKVVVYTAKLAGHAQRLDSSATPLTHRVIEMTESEGPFKYPDTASSRAEIDALSDRLKRGRIAIVGLGGTGSYVLDLVAKTRVTEIHLYDNDLFFQHNSFRGPGAATIAELKSQPKKVAYWAQKYAALRHRLYVHEVYIDTSNVDELASMDFVFICIDAGPSRKLIAEALEATGTSFIDVGMGLVLGSLGLSGIVRTTTVTRGRSAHMSGRLPYGESRNNEYARNIQIADLNALNAALAVIKWKKLWGFYADPLGEYHSTYSVAANNIVSEIVE